MERKVVVQDEKVIERQRVDMPCFYFGIIGSVCVGWWRVVIYCRGCMVVWFKTGETNTRLLDRFYYSWSVTDCGIYTRTLRIESIESK